jgi:antitoxin (DNA-binding transcriptional repressor) of toxin-antitoxin stability system
MVRMSTTEVALNFSAVVNRVIGGERIEVTRYGVPVAELRPPSKPQGLSGEAWRKFLKDRPPVDPDFARELEETRKSLGPPVSKWPAG